MDKEVLKKQINNFINARTNYWNAFLLISGGTVASFFNLDNNLRIIFAGIGILLSILLFNLHISLNKDINKFINELNRKEAKNDKL